MTRFDLLCLTLLVLAITGWPAGFFGSIPEPVKTIIVVVILLVLLLFGVVRF